MISGLVPTIVINFSFSMRYTSIPVGYTHNIENLGDTDMVTIMWVNEMFDPNQPDTYF
jgi:UDP-2-acetamido-2,6-beta-L-arabino-hexul-4-ose reductase